MGNSSIYCSNGLVLDATAPVFNGIEDNATYCVSRDFTVVEENLDTLTANGTVLIPVNGKYTLSQTGQNVVVAADKAGNSKTVTVTINASHVYDHDCDADCNICGEHREITHDWSTEWYHDSINHWHECNVCSVKTEIGAHKPAADDGDCTTPILCSVCDRVLTPAKQHDFSGQWHHDEHGHFHMCRNNGCTAADEHHDHSWLEGTPDPAPTYFTEGQRIDTCADCFRTKTVVLPILVDDIAPTGTVSIGTNRWNSFLNTITFGCFFKETQSVTVEANDNESGIDKTFYFLADRALTIEEAEAITDWTEFEGSFSISPNNSYVVYVKITDKVGNSAIINTDGLVLENITPVISGAADGDVFCEPVTINVSDDNLLRVTVNGVEVELTDGRFTVEPANKAVTITATDKAGNTKSLTIAVYDGHEWDEGVVTTAPTASTTGEILFTCVHCGEARTEVLPKIAPAIVEGKENVWNPTDGGTITFKSDAAFADFIRVTVDGIELDAANYELSEGSIIVTLKEEYLETLTVGTHILGIESVSGTAFTEFTVEAARTNPVINALTTFISVLLMILITFLRSYQVLHG